VAGERTDGFIRMVCFKHEAFVELRKDRETEGRCVGDALNWDCGCAYGSEHVSPKLCFPSKAP
jgi:hypothetical protein